MICLNAYPSHSDEICDVEAVDRRLDLRVGLRNRYGNARSALDASTAVLALSIPFLSAY